MNLTKISFLAAPALVTGYGVVRLMDGRHGPGFGWTFGHLLMLAGLFLFGWVIAGLRRLARRGLATNLFAVVGGIGLVASWVQIGIDIVVGLLADDAAAKDHDFQQIQKIPGVVPVVYTVVPVFFYVGLLALTVLAAVAASRRSVLWAPLLVLAGTVAVATNLDFMPEAGIAYLIAFTLFLKPASTRQAGASLPRAAREFG